MSDAGRGGQERLAGTQKQVRGFKGQTLSCTTVEAVEALYSTCKYLNIVHGVQVFFLSDQDIAITEWKIKICPRSMNSQCFAHLIFIVFHTKIFRF